MIVFCTLLYHTEGIQSQSINFNLLYNFIANITAVMSVSIVTLTTMYLVTLISKRKPETTQMS